MISEQEDGRERTGKMNSQAKLENFHIFHSPSQRIPGGGDRGSTEGSISARTPPAIYGSPGRKNLPSPALPANVNSFAESLNTICLEIQNFLLHSGAARGKCTVLSAKPWNHLASTFIPFFFGFFFLVFFFSKCQLWPLERLFL